jgi:hypothetical protein
MALDSKSNKEVEQALNILVEVIKKYNEIVETITQQKPFATLDYDDLQQQLNDNMLKASKLKDKLHEKKIELEYVDALLQSLIDASQSFARIIIGLGDKANRTGKYGWFRYRGDLKDHDKKRAIFLRNVNLFSSTIQEEPAEDRFIKVRAKLLDPMSDEPYEDEIEILESHYQDAKDESGYIYIIRSYEDGKPKDVTTSKEIWDNFARSFADTALQSKQSVDDIMRDLRKQ